MRHNDKKTGLRLTRGYYKALRRNLLTSLFKHDTIKTTSAKARTLKPLAEKVITAVKTHDEKDAIRFLQGYITEEAVCRKIVTEAKTKYSKKSSGFVSTVRLGQRGGDAAPIVQLTLN